jgi:hypothetical protein
MVALRSSQGRPPTRVDGSVRGGPPVSGAGPARHAEVGAASRPFLSRQRCRQRIFRIERRFSVRRAAAALRCCGFVQVICLMLVRVSIRGR